MEHSAHIKMDPGLKVSAVSGGRPPPASWVCLQCQNKTFSMGGLLQDTPLNNRLYRVRDSGPVQPSHHQHVHFLPHLWHSWHPHLLPWLQSAARGSAVSSALRQLLSGRPVLLLPPGLQQQPRGEPPHPAVRPPRSHLPSRDRDWQSSH